jgi:hypothetical protein
MCYLTVILAFLLTPGILVTLPPGGSKYTVALVHALLLGLILWFLQSRKSNNYESGKKY